METVHLCPLQASWASACLTPPCSVQASRQYILVMQNYLAGGLCSSQSSFTQDGQNLKIGEASTALLGQRGLGGFRLVLWLDHLCTGLLLARPVVLGLPLADERSEIRPPDSEVPSNTSRLVF